MKSFVDSKVCDQQRPLSPPQETDDTIRVVLPFLDQISADIVKKQLNDLSLKVHTTIQPVCFVYFSEPTIKVQYGDYQSDVREVF